MGLIPRDEKFFDFFAELATRLSASATLLDRLFTDPRQIAKYVAEIKELEHEADHLTHSVIDRIDRSFITPIDREDIHLLASRLDTVIDHIDGAARLAAMFHIAEPREDAKRLAEVICRAAGCIEEAVKAMKQPKVVAQRTRDIKLLEEEGDAIYQEAVGRLFRESKDALEVIKWKDLYQKLEDTLDQCEDVANALESISIKNS